MPHRLPPLPSNIQVFGEQVQGTRSVAEFSFRRYENRTAIGWFHPDHPELQSLNNCPALNAPLQPLFQTIAHNPPPLKRCRIRIRVSPTGVLGCWIDAANTDILKLLKEADWLKQLMTHAVVEIGQKHKRVVETEKGLSLRKPILEPWFQSYGSDGTPIHLWSTIAGFSQPSMGLNATLVDRVLRQIKDSGEAHWLEFGAGSGNYAAHVVERVECHGDGKLSNGTKGLDDGSGCPQKGCQAHPVTAKLTPKQP